MNETPDDNPDLIPDDTHRATSLTRPCFAHMAQSIFLSPIHRTVLLNLTLKSPTQISHFNLPLQSPTQVESLELPKNLTGVDVIISEWMGYTTHTPLLHPTPHLTYHSPSSTTTHPHPQPILHTTPHPTYHTPPWYHNPSYIPHPILHTTPHLGTCCSTSQCCPPFSSRATSG